MDEVSVDHERHRRWRHRLGMMAVALTVLGCHSGQTRHADQAMLQPAAKASAPAASPVRADDRVEPADGPADSVGSLTRIPAVASVVADKDPERPLPQRADPEILPALHRDDAGSQRVQAIGKRLAGAAGQSLISFEFGILHNPRARTFHTHDGHIYVTTGMLQGLDDDGQLAAVLALEMAEMIQEQRQREDGGASRRMAAEEDVSVRIARRTQEKEETAATLVRGAGFSEIALSQPRPTR